MFRLTPGPYFDIWDSFTICFLSFFLLPLVSLVCQPSPSTLPPSPNYILWSEKADSRQPFSLLVILFQGTEGRERRGRGTGGGRRLNGQRDLAGLFLYYYYYSGEVCITRRTWWQGNNAPLVIINLLTRRQRIYPSFPLPFPLSLSILSVCSSLRLQNKSV